MRQYGLNELATILRKELRGTAEETQVYFQGVSTDTRSLEEKNLFIALEGPNFNAHHFLKLAARQGAVAFIVHDEEAVQALDKEDQRPYLLVEDTELALVAVAKWYRTKINGQVIGVTGSVGKTSTRQMVMAALNRSLKVSGTKANLNNHIGLAGTILATDEQTGVLVLEMGIDRPGDMLRLSQMANPDIAIVTGVGVSHIAQFGNRESILKAKLEIRHGLRENGFLVLNGDNDLLSSYARDHHAEMTEVDASSPVNMVFISTNMDQARTLPGRTFVAQNIRTNAKGSSFDCWEVEPEGEAKLWMSNVKLPVPGKHQIQNSLFALLVADLLGVRSESAKDGLLDFQATGDRQRLMEARGVSIINDAYNASPESMKAALDLLKTIAGDRRKLAALGGMNELGDMEETLHFNLGLDVARSDVDAVFLLGPQAAHVEKGIHSLKPDCPVEIFDSREEMEVAIPARLEDNDILLIKASRGFEMEKLVEAIAKQRLLPEDADIQDEN